MAAQASSSSSSIDSFSTSQLSVSLSEIESHAREVASSEHLVALAQQFYDTQTLFRDLSKNSFVSSTDLVYQTKVRNCLEKFMVLYFQVHQLSVFSSNEEIDDVSTGDLKYSLVPFFLGDLCLKIADSNREAHLKAGNRYLLGFLRQCSNFNILNAKDRAAFEQFQRHNRSASSSSDEDSKELAAPAARPDPNAERLEKLDRLRRKKDAEKQLETAMASLKIRIKRMGADAADENADDDENERKYIRAYLEFAILQSLEHLNLSARELQVLAMRPQFDQIVRAEASGKIKPEQPAKPKVMRIEPTKQGPAVVSANFKVDGQGNLSRQGTTRSDGVVKVGGMRLVPLEHQISLRSQVAAQVFREFNPPTMDDDQYMKLLEQQGFFAQAHGGGNDDKPETVDSEDEDEFDKDTLKKREWDNWKDMHDKGAGNTLNKR